MLGAAVGVIAILLVASGKLSVGVLIVLFIALAVAWMLRKIVFRILGAAVIVYGVYIMLDVLLGNDHNVGPRPRRPLLFQPASEPPIRRTRARGSRSGGWLVLR